MTIAASYRLCEYLGIAFGKGQPHEVGYTSECFSIAVLGQKFFQGICGGISGQGRLTVLPKLAHYTNGQCSQPDCR